MKPQAYQIPEIRDENDAIIQVGTYGKKTALANHENTGALDYINNNLEALKNALTGAYVYVTSFSGLPTTGDANKIYVTNDTGKSYKWTGTAWAELTSQLNGLSAYQIAKADGYTGTETEWLASLKGDKGDKGDTGAAGLSAYQIAQNNGYTGTETEWLASLKGDAADLATKADKATTAAGYGITDVYTKEEVDAKIQAAIASLSNATSNNN